MGIINNLIMQIDQTNVVVYPNTVGQAVYMNIDNGYTLPQALNDIRNNAVSEWINILNKPFTTLRPADFQVVDGQLRLNGSFSADWDNIRNKPSYYPSSWALISAKPETYPSYWGDISGKPSFYPSNWNIISDKPEIYNTDWEHVANAPDAFNTDWGNIQNKPFNYLNENHFILEYNKQLSINNLFIHVNESEYQDLKDHNRINSQYPYVLYRNIEENANNGLPYYNGLVLKQVNNISMIIGGNYDLDRKNKRIRWWYNNYYSIIDMIADNTYLCQNSEETINNYVIFTSSPYKLHFNKNCDYLFSSYYEYNNDGKINNANIYLDLVETAAYSGIRPYDYGDENITNFDQVLPNLVNFYHGWRSEYSYSSSNKWIFGEKIQNIAGLFNQVKEGDMNFIHGEGYSSFVGFYFSNIFSYPPKQLGSYQYPLWHINYFQMTGNNYKINIASGSYEKTSNYEFTFYGNLHRLVLGPVNMESNRAYPYFDYYLNNALNNSWCSFIYYANENRQENNLLNYISFISGNNDNNNGCFYPRFVLKTPYGLANNLEVNVDFPNRSYFNLSHLINYPIGYNNFIINTLRIYYNDMNNGIQHFYLELSNTKVNYLYDSYTRTYITPNNGTINIYNLTIGVPSTGAWFFFNLFHNNSIFQTFSANNVNIQIAYVHGLESAYYDGKYNTSGAHLYSYCENVHTIYIYNIIDRKHFAILCEGCNNLKNVTINLLTPTYNFVQYHCPKIPNCLNIQNIYTDFYQTAIVGGSFNQIFATSDFKAAVEFNVPLLTGNVNGLFNNQSLTYSKKVHIIANSDLDLVSQQNLDNFIYMPNADNFGFTTLSNGRYYENYNLYIYNDYTPKTVASNFIGMDFNFYNPISTTAPSSITEVNDILLTRTSKTSADIDLGPYDINKNISLTQAYYNTTDKNIYLYYNSSPMLLLEGISGGVHFSTSLWKNVKKMSFLYDSNLQYPAMLNSLMGTYNDISGYNLFNGMFDDMYSLEEGINIEAFFSSKYNVSFNAEQITFNAAYMYNNCTNLRILPSIRLFRNCYTAFNNCRNLTGALTLPKVTNTQYAFQNCVNITSISLKLNSSESRLSGSGFSEYTFCNCHNLKKYQCEVQNGFKQLYNDYAYGYYAFYNCFNLEYVKISYPKNFDYNQIFKIVCKNDSMGLQNSTYLVYEFDSPSECWVNNQGINLAPNMVVANEGNYTSLNHWETNYIEWRNYMYNSYSRANNITIASAGNGTSGYYKYNNCSNLVMAACSELPLNRTDICHIYYSFNFCNSLVYGLPSHQMNAYSRGIYVGCSNLLVFDYRNIISFKHFIKRMKETANIDYNEQMLKSSVRRISESYNACFNLPYADTHYANQVEYSFANCYNLRYLIIRNKVWNLYSCFNNCNNLYNIYWEKNGILQWMSQCFTNCTNLKEVFIPSTLINFHYSFTNCTNLKTIHFPIGFNPYTSSNNFNDLGYSFTNCVSIENIYNICTIKNDIQTFQNKPNLMRVTISPECIVLNNTFYNCPMLKYIGGDYNNMQAMIGTFRMCTNLITAVCGDNVVTMSYTYADCYNLTTAACGNNVISMPQTYLNCNNLTHAVCGNNVTAMVFTYQGCHNLTHAVIGPKVVEAPFTYQYCYNLVDYELPMDRNIYYCATYAECSSISGEVNFDGGENGAPNITGYAIFRNSNISSFKCNNVANIGYETYGSCPNLTDVWLGNNIKTHGGEYGGAGSYNVRNFTIMDRACTSRVGDHSNTCRMNVYLVANSPANSSMYGSKGMSHFGGYTTPAGEVTDFWTLDSANSCYYNTECNLYVYYNIPDV